MSTVVLVNARHEPELEAMLDDVPEGVELRFLPLDEAVPRNEGRLVGKAPPLRDHLSGVEVLVGSIGENDFPHADSLKWIQLLSIGAEGHMYPTLKESDVILTNTKDNSSTHLSEQAFALLLSLTRRIREQHEHMKDKTWKRISCEEISDSTIGIIGMGGVGKAVALRAHAFGMRVLGVDIEDVEKPDFVERIVKPDQLGEIASECDVMVSCVPSTPESHKMIDGDIFGRMKPSSYFINVSRGKVVDEDALIEALQADRLAGAGLDVTYVEPCPPDSRLWDLPNVILTAHSAGSSQHVRPRALQVFIDNLHRYVKGEPLEKVVDKQKGY
jgi:phosphoglycerate dehydrogenase-like enzyme